MPTVTPGTLRSEGPGFKPSRDLAEFVRTTLITDLGPDAFGSEINFVFSQSEPPATSSRNPGTLWYRRGEGRLYSWQTAWPGAPELLSDTSYSGQGMWVAMSDRKEFINRAFIFGAEGFADVDESYIRNVVHGCSADTGSRGGLRDVPHFTPRFGDIRSHVYTGFADDGFEASYVTVSSTQYVYERLVDVGYGILPIREGFATPAPACVDDSAYTGARPVTTPYASDTQYMGHIVESNANTTQGQRMQCFIFTEARRFNIS